MSYQIASQYIDTASGFHVIQLRDGAKWHFVQIAIGAKACPACGHVYPKDLSGVDPKAMVEGVIDGLNKSHQSQIDYANKHGVKVK